MLSLDHHSRRNFLKVGTLGLGGLSLTDLMALRSFGSSGNRLLKDKSVIFLFMHGGPSQFETFDPKMDMPSDIRSATGEIPTSIPGITFGSTLQRLSKLADKFSVVRSFYTGDGQHDIKPIMCRQTLGANMGSLYSRIAGPIRPRSAMPSNVALYPQAVDENTMPPILNFGDFNSSGDLGVAYSPFVPGAGSGLQADMKLNLKPDRIDDRKSLLAGIDGWRRMIDTAGVVDGLSEFQQQAFSTLQREVHRAFDLSHEDPRLIARYDTAPLVPKNSIRKVWKNRERYADNAASLGKLMLLARRLCERDVGFVTVTTNFVWDMHADQNNATMPEGMGYVGLPFDHAISAFIEDVESRGLRDKILLVCCGEMGRTPRINARGGRDHWGGLAPLMVYGGGLKMGRVIGQSTRDGGEPDSNGYNINNLMATIMHTLLDVGEVRVADGLPRKLVDAVAGGTPIDELI
ncbi:MAG: hypothetical protein CMO80_03155 [Verrucomicrobiales bacterium]|nr:hypothetical protein [Verrucomicrobiales bacterium]|tara:strand:+ start:1730 stop:3112 length:1383 start_codon:yes stop_codon:yes gene_type:complete